MDKKLNLRVLWKGKGEVKEEQLMVTRATIKWTKARRGLLAAKVVRRAGDARDTL